MFNKSEASVILASGSDSVLVYKMADNSVISLNKNSKLIYSSGFGKTNRNVELSGEAFFEVKHDSAIPFVVRTGKLQIKDIGTAFNVHAPENADTIEVHVESGIVAFYTDNNPGITLNKGERGIYIKSSNVFLKSGISDPNETAYATRTFEFRDRELIEIVRELNKLYKQTISLSQNGISQCRITVRFQNESLENIANILAETLGLQVVKVPGGFLLKGESCNNKP